MWVFFHQCLYRGLFHRRGQCNDTSTFNWTVKPMEQLQFDTDVFLRRCKTAITWLGSLSAILSLFWRHGIADLHRLCREDSRNVLWRHETCDVFPRIMTCALQNTQFSQYFTMEFKICHITWLGSLFVSTQQTFYEWFLMRFEWSDLMLWLIIWFENFHFVVICAQMSSQTLSFYTFLSIWK